jgi:hypothetical protein
MRVWWQSRLSVAHSFLPAQPTTRRIVCIAGDAFLLFFLAVAYVITSRSEPKAAQGIGVVINDCKDKYDCKE